MKRALIVAINKYPDPYVLRGCLNDSSDLTSTLYNKFGFRSFTYLLDANATKANILSRLNTLVVNAAPGDSIVFAFFGHGSYIKNLTEPDGRSECICPVDIFPYIRVITDKDIAKILAKKKAGVNCDVILGCCFSGTGTRSLVSSDFGNEPAIDELVSTYNIPGPLEPVVEPTPEPTSDDLVSMDTVVTVPTMNHVLWASCKDNQVSWEVRSNGKYCGLFPLYLCWALRTYPKYTRKQIDGVVTKLVTRVISSQTPQLEGPASELSQVAFT